MILPALRLFVRVRRSRRGLAIWCWRVLFQQALAALGHQADDLFCALDDIAGAGDRASGIDDAERRLNAGFGGITLFISFPGSSERLIGILGAEDIADAGNQRNYAFADILYGLFGNILRA